MLNAAESPADFFPNGVWKGTGEGMAERIAGRRASGDWARSASGAMAVAGWNAAVPAIRGRIVGNPNRSADKANGSRSDLF